MGEILESGLSVALDAPVDAPGGSATEDAVAFASVHRPEPGETLVVPTEAGLLLVVEFDPTGAGFAVEGDDFMLILEDGARVVFEHLVSAARGENAPRVQIAGIAIGADVLIDRALALAGVDEPIETAAGEDSGEEGVAGGGGSEYVDSFGDLIAGLIKQGTIGATGLGDGPAGNVDSEFPVEAGFLSEGFLPSGGSFSILDFDSPGVLPAVDLGPSGGLVPLPGTAPQVPLAGDGDGDGSTPLAGTAPQVPLAGDGDGDGDGDGSTPLAGTAPQVPLVGDGDGDGDGEGSAPLAGTAPEAPPAGDGDGGALAPLVVDPINIVTNEATGNLQIPDELIRYLADGSHGQGLSVSGAGYDGMADNAYIWDAGGQALDGDDPANTWAQDGNGNIRFHIQDTGPFYEGSFTYEMTDGQGATGQATIHVENFATTKAGGYRTLTGTGANEVLLGQDGKNQIDGGAGNDIIHGGHDSGGDILIGGAGDDVIFGGPGKDDLQGGTGDDTFLMSAGFGRDDVDGGDGTDIISLDSVLTQGDVDDLSSWLTLDSGHSVTDTADGVISLSADASGTIDLGGGNEIAFLNIEQIVYADIV